VIAAARERVPGLRAKVFGDGPERPELLRQIERLGLRDVVEAPGFVDRSVVDEALRHATCLLLPSSREGYGLVVIEAASAGTPSVIVEGEDNAAVELVAAGVNGQIAPSADPAAIAGAIAAVHEQGEGLRRRTSAWFAQAAPTLTAAASARTVLEIYARR
jgi:glycosyltransferase involved in cell wall biosynthesis